MTEISQVVTPVRRRPNPPIGVPLVKKQARLSGAVSNPRRRRVQSVSNPLANPVTASDLGPCVPAKTTGTRTIGTHKAPYPG